MAIKFTKLQKDAVELAIFTELRKWKDPDASTVAPFLMRAALRGLSPKKHIPARQKLDRAARK